MVIDGIYYAIALTAGGALVWYLTKPWFALPLFALSLFCLYFFRDPERPIPDGPVAVSPADGKVVGIRAHASSDGAPASPEPSPRSTTPRAASWSPAGKSQVRRTSATRSPSMAATPPSPSPKSQASSPAGSSSTNKPATTSPKASASV